MILVNMLSTINIVCVNMLKDTYIIYIIYYIAITKIEFNTKYSPIFI